MKPAFARNAARSEAGWNLGRMDVSDFGLGSKVDCSFRVFHICQQTKRCLQLQALLIALQKIAPSKINIFSKHIFKTFCLAVEKPKKGLKINVLLLFPSILKIFCYNFTYPTPVRNKYEKQFSPTQKGNGDLCSPR